MKEIKVTLRITPEQEAAIKEIAEDFGKDYTVEGIFETMMQHGSTHDINDKIKFWRFMLANGKKNRAASAAKEG